MTISRRNLIRGASGLAGLSLIGPLHAQDRHHVVVVGGGFGGSTLARYLALWGDNRFLITLVDPRESHASCVMSNLVLTGALDLGQLSFSHAPLADRFGFETRVDAVSRIDLDRKRVDLSKGGSLGYDSLVLAPGIEFDAIEGYDADKVPHAWIAGEQTLLLKQQLDDVGPGDQIVLTIPKAPYRCPPGPYERACLLAALAREKTLSAGGGLAPKVLVLDANDRIQAEEATFTAAFNDLYGDIIEYRPSEEVLSVDSDARSVTTSLGTYFPKVLNVIPNHRAPALLRDAGLTQGSSEARWAPVDPVTYESTVPGADDVYVIGDAQATGQPKSGHMANAQAKVCADAIVRKNAGLMTHTQERLLNITTNSACFSPVSFDEASWLTAVFRYNSSGGASGSGAMELVPESFGASEGWSRENYREMFTWASNLFSDTFV
jgi:NADPH-dependent 2,4-dienoyl-CoA reductase/sulfur reductase-like enzyme